MCKHIQLCFFLICLTAYRSPAQGQDNDSTQLLPIAANGYRANLEAFEYLTCHYSITWGFTNSLEDAIASKLEPNSHTAKCEIIKDGKLIRFRLVEDTATKSTLDKATPQKTPGFPGVASGPLVPWTTSDYVLNADRGLLFDPRNHTANIYRTVAKEGVDPYYFLTMLGVNTKHDFGLLADQATKGESHFTVGAGSDGGRVPFVFRLPKDQTLSVFIDLNRGALPVRVEHSYDNSQLKSITLVPEIRPCSKSRWFPDRIVSFVKQSNTQSPCLVRDYKVTDLDVDRRPSRDAFFIDIPAGTVICQFDDSRKYFKTRQPEKVGPDDLARIEQLTVEVPRVPQTDTTIVAHRSHTWIWYAAIGVIGLLVTTFFGAVRSLIGGPNDVSATGFHTYRTNRGYRHSSRIGRIGPGCRTESPVRVTAGELREQPSSTRDRVAPYSRQNRTFSTGHSYIRR
jgi:hypothetical protein